MKRISHTLLLTLLLLPLAAITLTLSACDDEEQFTTDPTATIAFSQDTISFDTLFSRTISTTQRFCVYNHGSKSLRLSTVTLASGGTSGFMINVDGQSGDNIQDVAIGDGDSIFVFVKVLLSAQQSTTPVLCSDDIIFRLESGQESKVHLQASGQDCEVKTAYTFTSDTTLTSVGLPIVVFDSLVVAPTATLTLQEGTTLYFHNGATLIVHGSLRVNGKADSPVIFRGDRLDRMFTYLPYDRLENQWGGITLTPSSHDNHIDHADIHSSSSGLLCQRPSDSLSVTNTVIHNIGGYGLYLEDCRATIANTQVSNCRYDCVNIVGGSTLFYHCTLAQFCPWTADRGSALTISDFTYTATESQPNSSATESEPTIVPIERAHFYNCLVTGYANDEVYASFKEEKEDRQVRFHHCVLLTDVKDPTYFDTCVSDSPDSITYRDTHFRTFDTHAFLYDFRLDSLSTARAKGSPDYSRLFPTDPDGNERGDRPDAGCYQYPLQ